MRLFAIVLAVVLPSISSAGIGSIYAPDPRYIPGTYLPLQAYLGGLGITLSSAEPALQAINTGAGNAFESYVNTAGMGGLLSMQGATVRSTEGFTGPVYAVRGSKGFAEIFASGPTGSADFVGGGMVIGGARGTTTYPDRGFGYVNWTDAFGGGLQFSTTKQGNIFGFSSGASGINESFFQIANGFAVWDFKARSTNVPARVSYHWGCFSNNRDTHSLWSTANGTAILILSSTASAGSLFVPAGDISASGSFLPLSDNTGSVGSGSLRFATIRAVTVTTGDLGFEDECCPVCGDCFTTGDDVVWRIRRQVVDEQKRTVSYAIPVHVECVE